MKNQTINTTLLSGLVAAWMLFPGYADAKKPVAASPENTTDTTTESVPEPAAATALRAKVTVAADGLHVVTAADLAALLGLTTASVSTSIGNGAVRISNMGYGVSWMPSADAKAVYFFGQSVDNPYGGENVYWIEVGVAGTKIASRRTRSASPVSNLTGFQDQARAEKDLLHATRLFFDADADFWLWDYVMPPYAGYTRKPFTVDLPEVSTATATAQIRVRLHGGMAQTANPDNIVRFYVNGAAAGQASWDGATAYEAVLDVSQSVLVSGANTVEVEGVVPAGCSYGFSYVDSIEVTYRRRYAALNDSLKAGASGNSIVTVTGFGASDIKVFDVANPRAPVMLSTVNVDGSAGDYRVTFRPPSTSSTYLTAALSRARTPSSMEARVSANLADPANAADYVIVTAESLRGAVGRLADYRRSQGLEVLTVTVDDIYDEFNEGLRDPVAIQAFLNTAATQWARAPRYVVLTGRGSFDFRNSLGYGDCLVPSLMMVTPFGLIVSDSKLADTDGDRIPDMAIGRIPVSSASELDAFVDKLVAYELGGTWKDNVAFVADNADDAGNYAADADAISSLVDGGLTVSKSYLGPQTLADVRTATFAAFNSGSRIVNYVGHGLMDKMAGEGILKASDLGLLNNTGNAPVVLSMSCLVGNFGQPGYDALGAALVSRAGGGAVAVWAAAGNTYSPESLILNQGAFDALFARGVTRLGDAVQAGLAKYQVEGHIASMSYLYNLLGDPATVMVSNGAF